MAGLGFPYATATGAAVIPPSVLRQDAGPRDALAEVRQALGPAPVNIDEITRATGLPSRDVQIAIMELALAGTVEFHGSQLVSLKVMD